MIKKCVSYYTDEEKVYFQLSDTQDGEKEIQITFKGVGGEKDVTLKRYITLDTTGPVITLNNGEYLYIPLGESYVEHNATCTDDSGVVYGECVVTIGEVNIDMSNGDYQYVRYTATDFLNNEVNVVRKILVEVEKDDSNNTMYWIGAGIGIAVVAALLFIQVWKNKEKQKNQSVL